MPSKAAPGFYRTERWQKTARAYLESQHWTCERCGAPARLCHHKRRITEATRDDPEVLFSWDNLEALCQDCHNLEHHGSQRLVRFDASGQVTGIRGDVPRLDPGEVARKAREFFAMDGE